MTRACAVLIPMELQERFSIPIKACSPDDLSSNRSWAVGALVVCAPGQVEKIKPLLPRKRALVPITYSSADEHIETIRNLTQPSLIALVSTSEYFLEVARAVLAPVAGQRHSLREYLLTASQGEFHWAADVFLCDLMAERAVRTRVNGRNVLLYRFISDVLPGAAFQDAGRHCGSSRNLGAPSRPVTSGLSLSPRPARRSETLPLQPIELTMIASTGS